MPVLNFCDGLLHNDVFPAAIGKKGGFLLRLELEKDSVQQKSSAVFLVIPRLSASINGTSREEESIYYLTVRDLKMVVLRHERSPEGNYEYAAGNYESRGTFHRFFREIRGRFFRMETWIAYTHDTVD